MDRDNLQLLALTLFGILGFFLFVLLLVFLELDELIIKHDERKISSDARIKSNEDMAMHKEQALSPILSSLTSTWREVPFHLLQAATANFSHSKLLHAGHSGETFVGSLDGGGQELVAVKRFEPSITSTADPYATEMHIHAHAMRFLRHSRHHPPYLVPLLGYCVEGQERLLIYEYAPYRDLARALAISNFSWNNNDNNSYLPFGKIPMPWITRLKVAIQVAQSLAFLHHTCQPPITHRDLKASSILLTKDFDVRLGSLSEARTLEEGEMPLYDIYCFGKVLLQLISGLNISEPIKDSFSHHPWMLSALPLINHQMNLNSFIELVDPSMALENEDLAREVLGVAILAKACLDLRTLENLSILIVLHFLKNPTDFLKEPFQTTPPHFLQERKLHIMHLMQDF